MCIGDVQSCRRNLSTTGKPTVIPGLPELAGLVGQMAAQWEAHAQQQAVHMDTTADAETDAVAGADEAATATDLDTAAASDDATAVEAAVTGPAGTSAAVVVQESTELHSEAAPSDNAELASTAVLNNGEAGISDPTNADEGPAVDANADPPVHDTTADAKASEVVAGVSTAPDSTNADAAETRRQKKKKTRK